MARMDAGVLAQLYRSRGVPGSELLEQVWQWDHWDVLTGEPGGVDYTLTTAGGCEALRVTPQGCDPGAMLYGLHGGGYITGSMYTHRKLFAHLAKALGARALVVNYRLLPAGVFPAPIVDAVAAYRWLLDQGTSAQRVIFTGDSAGGGLTLTSQLWARDRGLPLPAAALPMSPWVDLEGTGASLIANEGRDALFSQAAIDALARDFLGGADPTDPAANPLHADLSGLGPLYVQVGDQELLVDDARRLVDRARSFGVDATLELFSDQQHTFQMMAGRAPEADEAIEKMARWVRTKVPGFVPEEALR